MKNIVLLFATMTSFGVLSCDVCGGAVAPGTQGLIPGDLYHYFGITQSYNGFRSVHDEHFSGGQFSSREHFLETSITARWQFSKRFNVLSEIPYHLNFQSQQNETKSEQGIGDIRIALNHLAVKIQPESNEHYFGFQYGLGIKLPTGAYARDPWQTSNLYPGSGSFDYFVKTNLIFRKGKVGLLQENSFILKGTNNVNYKFGSSLLTKLAAFYQIKLKKGRVLLPSIGAMYIYTGTDKIDGIDVAYLFNSGHTINAEVGINVRSQNWMLSLKSYYPLYQHIGNGDVKSLGGVQLGIHYLIKKK